MTYSIKEEVAWNLLEPYGTRMTRPKTSRAGGALEFDCSDALIPLPMSQRSCSSSRDRESQVARPQARTKGHAHDFMECIAASGDKLTRLKLFMFVNVVYFYSAAADHDLETEAGSPA
ncbi:hypothetical protein PGTUg99_036608 [Puccinia graminis f. sp. tritici]|uniref:Uncharacterized protein n=1 Tax=Puccinia graminis f. sp. tritici TaxID=56615 RepID=A0A5B0NLJ7_PUCGR|nr:hypothetical protein PGTUg99_036608 [Puccinia graminis f. sp. tritici]